MRKSLAQGRVKDIKGLMMCECLIISLTSNVNLGTYITKKREERELVLVQEIKLDGHSNTKDKNTAREKQAAEEHEKKCACACT